MTDDRAVQPLRHCADNRVTVPINPGFQIGILGEGFVRKISAGQQSAALSTCARFTMFNRPIRVTSAGSGAHPAFRLCR
jgi:hypothetical protein